MTPQRRARPPKQKVCVRCFRLWKKAIEAEEKVPECVFVSGARQRKCGYCSERRSQCKVVSIHRRRDRNDRTDDSINLDPTTSNHDTVRTQRGTGWVESPRTGHSGRKQGIHRSISTAGCGPKRRSSGARLRETQKAAGCILAKPGGRVKRLDEEGVLSSRAAKRVIAARKERKRAATDRKADREAKKMEINRLIARVTSSRHAGLPPVIW